MRARLTRLLKRAGLLLLVVLLTLAGIRIYDSQRGRPLEPWHTFVPEELTAAELDRTDWDGYLARERAIFDELRHEITDNLPAEDRVPVNR